MCLEDYLSVRYLSEELSLKNDEKHKNFEELESMMPAQKVCLQYARYYDKLLLVFDPFCGYPSHHLLL